MNRRTFRTAASVMLAAGVCLLARDTYLRAKAALAGHLLDRAWAEELRTGRPVKPWPWADTHPVGRLRVARVGLDAVVVEGASPRNLAFGPAHVDGTAVPGERGHVVLAGHRTSWFEPLRDIATGDVVDLEGRGGSGGREVRRSYRVASIRIVEPQDTSALQQPESDRLTLVTCYPFGASPSSPLRYVVEAVPAS